METSKKFVIFHKAETVKKLLIFPEMEPCLFKPRLKKLKKIHPEKIAYTLIFSQKKAVLLFQETKIQRNFLYFLKRKLFLHFEKRKPRKKPLIFQEEPSKLENQNLLCFSEKS